MKKIFNIITNIIVLTLFAFTTYGVFKVVFNPPAKEIKTLNIEFDEVETRIFLIEKDVQEIGETIDRIECKLDSLEISLNK